MLWKALIVCGLLTFAGAQKPCPLDNDGSVDLSHQGLNNIDADMFETIYDCKQYVANITSLDLSNNVITSVAVDSFGVFYELINLNLSHNDISSLDNNTFNSLRKIENLDVSYNSLTYLGDGLISLVSLKKVWFNNNNISDIGPDLIGQVNVGLIYFNMNNNSLTYFDPWPYKTYQTYQRSLDREFFFQYNNITAITNNMNWTYDLRYPFEVLVYLQYNDLKTMSIEVLRLFDSDLEEESMFAAFLTYNANITHNPFFCDCKLYPLASVIRGGIFRYSRVEEYRYRCGSPTSVEGMDFLHDIPLDKLVCNITNDCPTGCYCEDRPHNDTFLIDCTNAGLTEMPKVIPTTSRSKLELFLDNNRIVTLSSTSYLTKIHNISLFGNRIESLDTDVLQVMNASRLDLRNNRIQNLPKEIRKFSYNTVLLSGNPLECDCDSVWLVDWLTLDSDTDDAGNMLLTCNSKTGNHRIVDISLKVLGCTNEWLIIICVCLGIALVLLAIALVFAKRCPYETRVILHKLFRIRAGKKYEVDSDDDKNVDIYMTFDDQCEDVIGWVRYFLKKLNRKKPVYSVLNPARFMEPGSQGKNIQKWIGKSKRMIVVLSDKIFENEWRCFEIDEAERRVIEAATLSNVNSNEESNESERNELTDLDNNRQDGACVIDIEDENLGNAPKVIYIIFNSNDLLKAKLDEDKWIERIGDRRNLRKHNPKYFDERAKEWQEKLQQEPWKSRLAGKAVLSPDDRMFWSKLRYELPPTGNGVGDGNFTFKRENPVPVPRPQRYEDRGNAQKNRVVNEHRQAAPQLPQFSQFTEKLRVHKTRKGINGNRNDIADGTNDKPCGNTIDDNVNIFTISRNENNVKQVCSGTAQNKENAINLNKRNGLLNVLQHISDTSPKESVQPRNKFENMQRNGNQALFKNVLMKAISSNEATPGVSRPGSGDKKNIDSETSGRIYTIGMKSNNPANRLTDLLDYSRTMRSNSSISIVSTSSSSSS